MLTDSSQKAAWLVLVFAYNQTRITKPSGNSWHLRERHCQQPAAFKGNDETSPQKN